MAKKTEKNALIEAGITGARAAMAEAYRRIQEAEMEIKSAKNLYRNVRGALHAIEKGCHEEDRSYCDLQTREALSMHYALNFTVGETYEVARQIVLAQDAARAKAKA